MRPDQAFEYCTFSDPGGCISCVCIEWLTYEVFHSLQARPGLVLDSIAKTMATSEIFVTIAFTGIYAI